MRNRKSATQLIHPLVGLFLVVGLVQAGRWVYGNVLPYYFSPQRHFPLIDESGEYDVDDQEGVFHGEVVRSMVLPDVDEVRVLGIRDPGVVKTIEVDLTEQKLYAKEDGKSVGEFMISSGRWGRTPVGTYRVWYKIRSTKMSGGSKELGTYYYLPNVPYTMFFYGENAPQSDGYGIHGAYWHSNFGIPMSHGCINMRPRDAEKLFYWAGPYLDGAHALRATADNPGIEITIYGKAPWM